MTSSGFDIVHDVIAMIWRFFTSWYIPGTYVTPAVAVLGFQFVGIVLRFIFRLLKAMQFGTEPKSKPVTSSSLTVRK